MMVYSSGTSTSSSSPIFKPPAQSRSGNPVANLIRQASLQGTPKPSRRSTLDEKYAKHKRQKTLEKIKRGASILLIALSVLGLWYFGNYSSSSAQLQKRVGGSPPHPHYNNNPPPQHATFNKEKEQQQNPGQDYKAYRSQNKRLRSHDDTLQQPKRYQADNSQNDQPHKIITTNEQSDTKQKHLDESMAKHIEELKQLQQEIRENEAAFEEELEQELEEERQGIQE